MLTDLKVRQAKPSGKTYRLTDFDGLGLVVTGEGAKLWHFRYYWLGKQKRLSFGRFPEVSLREARALRDDARALVVKGINPQRQRAKARFVAEQAEHLTFDRVYQQWFTFRALRLKTGRNSTREILPRVFENDVLPALGRRPIYDISRFDLLEILERIEKRGATSVAKKVRSWFSQMFRYAVVKLPGLEHNPATDLDVVAMPAPPVRHNPFLRMPELPEFLRLLRKYPGVLQTQLGIRLLLLTGVRTGELRAATPDQFCLDEGLWVIPPEIVKQLETKMMKQNIPIEDIPPYIVPLSAQAVEIVRHMLNQFKPAQKYVFAGAKCLRNRISENTLNGALIRMGYRRRLTGHGIRGTLSTALNELGYPEKWIDAQLSHADPDAVRATYNHAEHVEPRRRMMQDWADRLDLFEQGQIDAASRRLTVRLEGSASPLVTQIVTPVQANPTPVTSLLVSPMPDLPTYITGSMERLSAVRAVKLESTISNVQRERILLLDLLEAPHNLPVSEYAKLARKSRRWITYEITAGNLLSISLGNRGQRVPDWQLDPIKHRLVQTVLKQTPRGVNSWEIYHALTRLRDTFNGRMAIDVVTSANVEAVARIVCSSLQRAQEQGSSESPNRRLLPSGKREAFNATIDV